MIKLKVIRWQDILYYLLIAVIAAVIIFLLCKFLAGSGSEEAVPQDTEYGASYDLPEKDAYKLESASFSLFGEIFRWLTGLDFSSPAAIIGGTVPSVEAPCDEETSPIQISLHKDTVQDISYTQSDITAKQPQPDKPLVMLYSTHSHEAYTMTAFYGYDETEKWRTENDTRNINIIGDRLAQLLEERGISVYHNKKDHEYPALGTAYIRSLETLKQAQKEYPSLQYFIDIHRDAYIQGEPRCINVDGTDMARLLFVIGNGEGKNGSGFSEKPDWQKNAAFAKSITDNLNSYDEEFCKPVDVRTGRYNQHVSPNAVLVEVGHNLNTLEEALASLPYLADAIADAVYARQ